MSNTLSFGAVKTLYFKKDQKEKFDTDISYIFLPFSSSKNENIFPRWKQNSHPNDIKR